jgi:hypothetical protein
MAHQRTGLPLRGGPPGGRHGLQTVIEIRDATPDDAVAMADLKFRAW